MATKLKEKELQELMITNYYKLKLEPTLFHIFLHFTVTQLPTT